MPGVEQAGGDARKKISGIKRRWFWNSISVIIGALFAITVTAALGVTFYLYSTVQSSLESRARESSKYIIRYMSSSSTQFFESSRRLVQDFSDRDKLEMQILDPYRRVEFSSSGLVAGFYLDTLDAKTAIDTKGMFTNTGYDPITGERIMATTASITNPAGMVIGAVRYVTSLRALDTQLIRVYLILAAGMAGLSAIIVLSNKYFIQTITNPIIKINQLATTIAGGQYGARLNVEFDDEIGQLCGTLNNMSAELARMEKVKNDFISSVSHELRTPLTAINGWAETVAHDIDDPAIATAGLEVIKNETQRLSQMVEELLDFSRIESGGLRLQTEDFDIRGVLYDAVFIYTDMLKSQGLEVRYSEPDDLVIVHGDKNRLKQVFLNIIDNAAKYGTGGNFLDVGVQIADCICVITFRDYGQGINEKELPFVKEKFFKGSARGRGTGIGLAVCNDIISLHGGAMEVESVFGEGTAVILSIPLSDEMGKTESHDR